MMPPCVAHIAQHYEVSAGLVSAVAYIESRQTNVGRVGPNTNGTYDLGIMQINTWWLQKSNPKSLLKYGITEKALLNNECTNVAVGAWMLRINIDSYGNIRAALAAYNTGKPASKKGQAYADRVINQWRKNP